MANFYDDFSGDLSNWTISTTPPVDRIWWTEGGLLKTENGVSGKEGLILYNTPIDVDGKISTEFDLDTDNGTDNMIIFRYATSSDFVAININPGHLDEKGVSIGFDDIKQKLDNDFYLYNKFGDPVDDEVPEYITTIPNDGKINIIFTSNVYVVELYDSSDEFVVSGTYIEPSGAHTQAGSVGFAHTINSNANMVGWNSISVNDTNCGLWGVGGGVWGVTPKPSVTLSVSGAPVCSGSDFHLIWSSENADTVILNNGIGEVSGVGSLTLSAGVSTNYTVSAINCVSLVTDSATAIIYHTPPIAYIGDDVSLISIDGDDVSATLDGSGSYDPDGLDVSYLWYIDGVSANTDESYTTTYDVGEHTVDLVITDPYGQSARDSIDVNVYNVPVANAISTPPYINAPGIVTLDGSGSYCVSGTIVSYTWKDSGGTVIGNDPIIHHTVPSYGDNVYTLTVSNSHNSTATATVDVMVTTDANPKAVAGEDQSLCLDTSATIILDGSGSLSASYPPNTELVWYEWDLSTFGHPNVSANITSPSEISATFVQSATGVYNPTLTVSANNGYIDIDAVNITLNSVPDVVAYDISATIPFGHTHTSVTLSAYTNYGVWSGLWDGRDPWDGSGVYVWEYEGAIYNEQHPTITFGEGVHTPSVIYTDATTGCVSQHTMATINISNESDLSILDFSVDPYTEVIDYGTSSTSVNLSWDVYASSAVYVNDVMMSSSTETSAITIDYPGGLTPFIISATDGTNWVTKTIYGNYIFDSVISVCKDRSDIAKTYGVDELKYGRDRYINLINYLPEYIKTGDTGVIVKEFESYLNTMYTDQKNYTWSENTLDADICETSACKQLTMCDDIYGTCGDEWGANEWGANDRSPATSAVMNSYQFESYTSAGPDTFSITTPADSVGERFIGNMCDINSDKISILDKIYRLTELFDPDLIPIDLIQMYAENLGYQAGISRDSVGDSRQDPMAREIEQKRYLRFMARNLPNWYKIKSNKASIRIMMYSFGLIGDFVYYYTKNYSDPNTGGLGLGTDPDSVVTTVSTSGTNVITYVPVNCTVSGVHDNNINSNDVADIRCCLGKYRRNPYTWNEKTGNTNGVNVADWVLTDQNVSSLDENLSAIAEDRGYFSSPHFRMWVNIDESTGNLSTDTQRQDMIKTAIDAIKPINSVFDGIVSYFETSPVALYLNSMSRVRRQVNIVGGTYLTSAS